MLYWVLLARRPLTCDELEQRLLSEECEFTDINDSPMALKHGFEWLCGDVLVVDSSSAQMSVRNKTVADYSMNPDTIKEFWGQEQMPNEHFCTVVMKYLSFSSLKTSSTILQESVAFETKLPLLQYALRHWGDYLEDTADNAGIWHKIWEAAQDWHDMVNTLARAMFADEFNISTFYHMADTVGRRQKCFELIIKGRKLAASGVFPADWIEDQSVHDLETQSQALECWQAVNTNTINK